MELARVLTLILKNDVCALFCLEKNWWHWQKRFTVSDFSPSNERKNAWQRKLLSAAVRKESVVCSARNSWAMVRLAVSKPSYMQYVFLLKRKRASLRCP